MIALIGSPLASLAAQSVAFDDQRWKLGGDATVDTIDGRRALRMENGSAVLPNVRLEDGTIDVDVRVTTRRSFVYVNFRAQDDAEREEFYLRPHKSSLPDAVQYAPVHQGQSAWQLYHGARGTASPTIPPNVWLHLRIVLSGRRAAFFLGDTITPFMVLAHLAREPKPGYIGLASFAPPGTPSSGPTAVFSNMRVSPDVVPYDFKNLPVLPALAAGTITTWDVGKAFAAPESALSVISPDWVTEFTRVPIEPDGFVALHRHVTIPPKRVTRFTGAVARFTVNAQTAGIRRLDLGFSDRVTVFLNGQPIFFRDDSYDFENRRDGLISFDQSSVYLPLQAGENTVSIIVSDRFGGWAIMGRFPDIRGLRI